ncbi:MAG TPA: hypothetical protein VMW19_11305 [Myxococcota bacterium]|nr:hypothetical protein [Myxococcota bacterium]
MSTLRRVMLSCSLALLAGSAACNDDKSVQLLEAKKSEILEHTQPKQDFWDQVGRQGRAVKQERSASEEIASLQSKGAETRAALDSLRKQLEDARATNAKAADVLSAQLAQRDAAEGEVAKNEATLASFVERRHTAGAP